MSSNKEKINGGDNAAATYKIVHRETRSHPNFGIPRNHVIEEQTVFIAGSEDCRVMEIRSECGEDSRLSRLWAKVKLQGDGLQVRPNIGVQVKWPGGELIGQTVIYSREEDGFIDVPRMPIAISGGEYDIRSVVIQKVEPSKSLLQHVGAFFKTKLPTIKRGHNS